MSTLPYTVMLERTNNHNIWPMKQWCYDNLGPRWAIVEDHDAGRNGTWTVLWAGPEKFHGYRWHFKNEADMLFFKLRWA